MYERIKTLAARLTGRDAERRHAHELYVASAEASRRPVFYEQLGVADTVEGRYDLLSLHIILLLRRLRQGDPKSVAFAQLVFDVMFRDVDDNLREMGVGDMRVGKKVRSYAEAFFGRAKAYDAALKGEGSLSDALSRNVYGEAGSPYASDLARYVVRAEASLGEQALADLHAGRVAFPDPLSSDNDEVSHAAQ